MRLRLNNVYKIFSINCFTIQQSLIQLSNIFVSFSTLVAFENLANGAKHEALHPPKGGGRIPTLLRSNTLQSKGQDKYYESACRL